jgi:demethylmenaquinone methyltransferase/2-methoxy-6-polyprenyl-1,4-benzoquinol methylase
MKQAWFDQLAPSWDSLPGQPETAARAQTFLHKVVSYQCARLLDAGAGTGVLVDPLLALPHPPRLIVELDFSPAMLGENRRKHGSRPQVRYVCASLAAPPFRSSTFDCVLVFNALPHVEDQRAALAALLGLLRPGGRLAVGHLMPSHALNAMHASIGGAVANDRLPPASGLARICASLGARVLLAEENPDEYTVLVEKPA